MTAKNMKIFFIIVFVCLINNVLNRYIHQRTLFPLVFILKTGAI